MIPGQSPGLVTGARGLSVGGRFQSNGNLEKMPHQGN